MRRRDLAAVGFAIAVAAVVLVWAAWLYRIPEGYTCALGANPQGAAHFREALRLPRWPLNADDFRRGFIACLVVAWVTYGIFVGLLAAGARPRRRLVLALAVVLALALAVLGPPALSPDVYAYAGYARLEVLHHLNPYVETQKTLVRLGDATGPFLRWPIASPYGALWTLVSVAVVATLPASALWASIVAFKVIGAAAVLAMAEGGRRLADRVAPGRGDAVFAAIALNPLFLLEGAVNAHNDCAMMALVLAALAFCASTRPRVAFLSLGLAASIKFLPLLLAPWLLIATLRQTEPTRRARVTAEAVALTVLPLVSTYALFWAGGATLAGLRSRTAFGIHLAGSPLGDAAVTAVLYAALTPWACRPPLVNTLRAWVFASLCALLVMSGIWFPWYFTWPWAVALVLLEGWDLTLTVFLGAAAFTSLWRYVR
jgi:hypothetical protein